MECLHVPPERYDVFSRRLQSTAATNRVPTAGTLELTYRCNNNCVHCYCNLPAGDKTAREEELATEQVFEIVDQIAKEGCLWLLLTGGEVFLREDALEIIRYCKQAGLLVTIFTNGTLITPEVADFLAEWYPLAVEITLYGATKDTYERVTRVPGSFERCRQGVELLLGRHVPVKLKAVLLQENWHELEQMQQYAKERSLMFRYDAHIFPRSDGTQEPLAHRLTPEQVVRLNAMDDEFCSEWRDLYDTRHKLKLKDADLIFRCGAGIRSFAVSPEGVLSLCTSHKGNGFDLRTGTFHEGWHRYLRDVRFQKRTHRHRCADCDLVALCGSCAAWSLLETGDLEGYVEYACEVAHLRAASLG